MHMNYSGILYSTPLLQFSAPSKTQLCTHPCLAMTAPLLLTCQIPALIFSSPWNVCTIYQAITCRVVGKLNMHKSSIMTSMMLWTIFMPCYSLKNLTRSSKIYILSQETHIILWQTFSKSLTISYFPLAAASWRGVNFHRSATLTLAPCFTSSSVTS